MSRWTIAVALAALFMPGGVLLAQTGATPQPGIRLRLATDTLRLRIPPQLQPGGILAPRTTPEAVARDWAERVRALLRVQRDRLRNELLLQSLEPEPARPAIPSPEAVAQPAAEQVGPVQQPTVGPLTEFADLGVDLNARIELVFDQLRNARCTAADAFNVASGCVGGFPTPTLQPRFDVRSSGIVGDRMHIDVDFDTEREFNANNSIIAYYEGLDDEILRRVDIGTVTFQAPPSRFITTGIPSNSFGLQAEAQLGALNFRAIAAQQKGSAVRVREFTVGEAATQPVDFEARDLDFEAGRFFFVVDPTALPGYPAVDILNIDEAGLPLALKPDAVRVYRLRAQSGQVQDNPNLGGIEAVAVRNDSPQRVGPFSWELLIEGDDYYMDPSGIWFALNTRVGTRDFLAVSYVTQSGDTVGTFPAVNGAADTLELIYEPRRGADEPTFPYEMRNAYRVGSREMDRATAAVSILVNNSETPLDGRGTYLSRLGVALSTDASTVDQFNRLFPRIRDPGGGEPLRDLFLVFPHLTPFADSTLLEAGERNDSLYRTPTYLRQSQGPPPKFALAIHYEAAGAGTQTSLNLGAIQVRVGSERIYAGERQLARGRDYEMDYALGQITFLNPDSLFLGPTQIRAEYEENQLFDDAPRSILGFSSSYSLGTTGDIHAIGIFQSERTVSNRPLLGFEPQALFIGGLSTALRFQPQAVTRFLDGLPLLNTTVPSSLEIDGEVAVSLPNSNRSGVAYLEDFEAAPSTRVNLGEGAFQLAAAPASGRGLPPEYLDGSGNFDPAQAVPLVWQNLIRGSPGDIVRFTARDIDSTIVLSGSGVSVETALWLTLKPDSVGGVPDAVSGAPRWFRPHTQGPRWRSIVQPLGGGSGVGVDLSRVEFFDFWVLEDETRLARQQGAYLVFDFGTVFEDAVGFGPSSLVAAGGDTTFSGFQLIGTGRLDSEKDPSTNVYNAQRDEVGILGDLLDSIIDGSSGAVIREFPTCDVRGFSDITAFSRGNLLARCSRGNGALDTEDLDGDNRLDVNVGTTQEDFFRYVFPVGDERYFLRSGGSHMDSEGRRWTWRLYRIPFRGDTVQVGRPNITQIRSLRITVAAPDLGATEQEFAVALARAQFVGAPWIKRSETPIAGLSGSQGEPRGEVRVSVITTQDVELGYESPPGVADEPPRSDLDLAFGSVEVNEKSLRLLVQDLRAGERGEALTRFTSTADKNFLQYRSLRVWARGHDVGWEEGDLEFLLKVGRDEHNFYLYKTPVRSVSWEPEIVIDITRWTQLRVQVENRWLSGAPPSGAAECGGDSTAYVACDGPYFIQVRDPGTSPPNLARVSEVAVGIFRAGETTTIGQAELWVDDIRLTDVIDDVGVATALDIRLAAADVAQITVGYSSVSDQFRQLEQEPSYVTDRSMRFGLGLNLDRFLPEAWGLSMPLQVRHSRSDSDPFYVTDTDVRADALDNLRRPGSAVTNVELGLRRARRGTSLVERTLLDPLSLRASLSTGSNTNSLSESSTGNRQVHADYTSAPRPKTFKAVPDFIIDFIDALPGFVSNSEFANALRTSRFRWNPQRLRFSSTLTDNRTDRTVFRVPVELAGDTTTRVLPSIRHLWRNVAQLDLRPFASFGLSASYESTRDLQDYGDSTAMGDYLAGFSGEFLGMDAGFERSRRITTGVDLSPVVSSWLRPRFILTSSFLFNRDPNAASPDTVMGVLRTPQSTTNSRVREMGATVDLARLFGGVFGDSSMPAAVMRGLLPADLSYARELRSNFNNIAFVPDLQYQLALGTLGDFRTQDGVVAASSGEITGFTITAGARLPLGTQVRLAYRQGNNRIWLARAEGQEKNEQRSLEWPSLTASWVYTPGERLRNLVSSISAQFEYRTVERTTFQPTPDPLSSPGTGAVGDAPGPKWTEDYTRTLAPRLTIIWPAGVSTSGSYSATKNRLLTSGNTRNTDQTDWNASLGFGFRPPFEMLRPRNEIRTTVSFTDSQRAVCLLTPGSGECRTVSDSHRRAFDVRMDTGLSETLRGGATFSYVLNELRHTSEELSQVVFSIYIDYRFFAGDIR